MKISFVTPWYGPDIPGGMESETRRTARRLQQRGHDVEILTTCVRDFFADWGQNHHKPGLVDVAGIPVRRFAVQKRNKQIFDAINQRLIHGQRVSSEEEAIFMQEMLHVPDLYNFIHDHQEEYLFFFIPYLFATTYYGAQICPQRSALIPCLHDEGYAYMQLFHDLFPKVKGLAFNTHSERQLAHQLYDTPADQVQKVVGIGVETEFSFDDGRFRQKYKLDGPILLYVGRRSPGKNTPLLLEYWSRYVQTTGSQAKLVLIGPGDVTISPENAAHIVDLGFVPLQDKYDAYAAADMLCQPSLNESFSLVMMESWLTETPVLAHAHCAVTKDHCLRSNGGLYFANYPEFAATLDYLWTHPTKAQAMGRNGRNYVLANFEWSIVLDKYQQLIDAMQANL